MEKYCVADYKDVHEFLAHLARRLGKLKKGGVADVLAAGRTVLRDWNRYSDIFIVSSLYRPSYFSKSVTKSLADLQF